MKTRSLSEKPSPSVQTTTASGRAASVRTNATRSPCGAYSQRVLGVTSRPSMRNMTIWQSHVTASWKPTIDG
jgi:hypothetical protein